MQTSEPSGVTDTSEGSGRSSPSSNPVAVSTAIFDGYPMEQSIEEIAALGACWVEPAYIRGYVDFDEDAFSDQAAQRLAAMVRRVGIGVNAVSAHLDLGSIGAADMLARRIRFAAGIGARYLVTNAGSAARRSEVLSVIDAGSRWCETYGVTLALENPGHGLDDLIANASAGFQLIHEIDSALVRLNYDIGNVFTYSHESIVPQQDIRAAGTAIAHVHLKDVARTADGWTFTAIGEGVIDYAAIWGGIPPGIPMTIELPLRLSRPGRSEPVRSSTPLALNAIRLALTRSLAAVDLLNAGQYCAT